jgi:serine/threonine protein kinase/WD40 repeat protein
MSTELTWFLAQGKEKRGPFTWEQLQAMAASGDLLPDDLVLPQDSPGWLPAKAIPALFSPPKIIGIACSTVPVSPSPEPSTVYQEQANATVSWIGMEDGSVSSSGAASSLPRVPGYELLGELGKGGMGIVYKARQAGLNRLVALKMIRSGLGAGREELERFRAEAQAVARLQHPNIVQIFEIGEWTSSTSQESMPFFSLEYVPGGSLAEKLAGHPQPPREAAELVETLAQAMHYAHAHGIIHRDLKPANVLLVLSGEPVAKITDFGLAKELDADSARTRAGVILGTPSYMSPEQAEGNVARIGPLTDVYALGAILYEMLTGRPPFRGTNAYETMEQVRMREPVPPAQLQPGVPRDLETISLKCLQKDPQKRYGSAAALAEDVRAFLDGKPIRARPVGKAERIVGWCRRNPVVAGLLAAVAFITLVSLCLVTWKWREALDREENEKQAKVDARNERNDARRTTAQSLLQQAIMSGEQDDGDQSLFLIVQAIEQARQAGDTELAQFLRRQLAAWIRPVHRLRGYIPVERVGDMALSQDGKRLWIASQEDLHDLASIPAHHRAAWVTCWDLDTFQRIYSTNYAEASPRRICISPDGRWGLSIMVTGIRLWETATGKEQPEIAHSRAFPTAACFTPDSQSIVAGDQSGKVQVWPLAGDRPTAEVQVGAGTVTQVVVSADGNRLATGCRSTPTSEVRLWSFPDLKPVGEPIKVARSIMQLAFDPSSRILHVGVSDGKIYPYLAATGVKSGLILDQGAFLHRFAIDRSGTRLVGGGAGAMVFDRPEIRVNSWSTRHLPNPQTARAVGISADDSFWFAAGGAQLSERGEIRLFALPGCWQLGPALRQRGAVVEALLSADARVLVSCSQNQGVALSKPSALAVWDVHRHPTFGPSQRAGESTVTFSPSGRLALFRSRGKLEIWNAQSGKPLGKPRIIPKTIDYVSVSGDDHTLLVWGGSSGLLLNLNEQEQPPLSLTGPPRSKEPEKVLSEVAVLSPDGRRFAAGDRNGQLDLWDLGGNKPSSVRVAPTLLSIEELRFSPCSRYLLVVGLQQESLGVFGHRFQVWDVERASPLGRSVKLLSLHNSICFAPDSQRVWLGLSDGQTQAWDIHSGAPVSRVLKQSGAVTGLSVSRDGKVLLAGSADRTARLWNTETEQPIGPAIKHGGHVTYTLLTPDGQLAVTADQNQTVRVWDVRAGRPLGPPLRMSGKVLSLSLTPDGAYVHVGCAGGKVVKYRLPIPETGTIAELTRRIERLTGTTLDEHGELRVLSIEEWQQRAGDEKP